MSMPFLAADRPSIQAGLLAAIAREHGFPAGTLHANLDLAARIGPAQYALLADHRGRLVGEWLFSAAAFGDDAPDPGSGLLEAFGDELAYLGPLRERLPALRRDVVPAYLEELVVSYPWDEVGVAGFSCVFQQSTASFALARRLKQRHPDLVTVFGGAAFEGVMGPELVRTVECVDLAVSGEADEAFPRLLRALATGDDPAAIPGVISRSGKPAPPAPPLHDLDALPVPDYGEFFERSERLGLADKTGRARVWIPVETARGCWWGARHHCTFCGLNGTTMAFRSKSPDRVLDELAVQTRRWGSFRFAAVDNILDVGYLRTLFPRIVAQGRGYEMFYEVKANLSRDQVGLLARAGVSRIQPGLESLSSRVLALMRKGTTAAQNINLLRWARYHGIGASWNVLWGFPGETPGDYAEQAAIMPHLAHLQPPDAAGPIWLERFSPLFDDAVPGTFRPEASNGYVYPDRVDLAKAAYFFEYDPPDADLAEAYRELGLAVKGWQEAWQGDRRPVLVFWSAPGYLRVYDGRRPGREGTFTFEGPAADVYAACSDRAVKPAVLRERLDLPAETVRRMFEAFQRLGLMFVDGGAGLALALPAVGGR
ncbi:RiPP maturation radical SAM C-methyltransferase [Actinoplanes sp. TBRC 11911]|uniref:RiPP maturation radical SAM C-methyltransferase n=1 Tax=Actinoplanes sp. TBRC 11911 TaxID=2729386 RepID=UPI00289B6510|nr:RiPP maturation radical SAM C-methyltransferase [Actinoplanes sp. TBRC 11911]